MSHLLKTTTAMLVLAGVTGCGPKLHKFVDNIDSVSVHAERTGLQPEVDFGEFEADRNHDGTLNGAEHIIEGQNIAIDVSAMAFSTRLDSQVEQRRLIGSAASNARTAMEGGRPFPLNPQSGWNMAVSIHEWGVSPGWSGSVDAYIILVAELTSPSDEPAWREYVTCRRDMAPETFTNASQIAANIAAMVSMSDEAIKHTFNELAAECGRNLAQEFREDVRRARAKAGN